jgi:iron(III) transport system substrate-binding protein
VAGLIDLYGRERTLEIVKGWVANDVDIMSNDILLLESVDSGACDVALVNHYYYARKLKEDPGLNVKLSWASQQGAGTHVNISGAGVVKSSDNPKQAERLLEWLATTGQSDFVDGNHEYPVNPDVDPEPLIAKLGAFKRMPLDPEAYGKLNAEATDLLAEAGYQ